jgi:hypothetical protein
MNPPPTRCSTWASAKGAGVYARPFEKVNRSLWVVKRCNMFFRKDLQ